MTHQIYRRQVLSLIGILALFPKASLAEQDVCQQLAKGLRLCSADGWTIQATVDDGATATLISANGTTANIVLSADLAPEEVTGARWMISHAPISARAMVLHTGFIEIDGQLGTTVAYLPRHARPAMVVASSDVIGDNFTLVVTTRETGVETYSETHQTEHAVLLAALRLQKDP
jgi:hypothetical protein